MGGEVFSLAFSGLLRRRRTSLMTLAALMISFAAGVVSLSLLGSISRTNAEFRLNTYGAWYGAIPNGEDGDVQWLSEREWIGDIGTAVLYGEVSIPNTDVTYGVGTMDGRYKDIGRIYLEDGHWPESDDEIAVEASLLERLGCDPACGQKITLDISAFTADDDVNRTNLHHVNGDGGSFTFEVCGIIHNYSLLWELHSNRNSLPLVGAVVTDAAGEAIVKAVHDSFTVSYPFFSLSQYFFTVREDVTAKQVILETNEYMRSTRHNWQDMSASYNGLAYPDIYSNSAEAVYQHLILAVTLFAVLCIYILQYPREVHTYAVFRAIGASRGRLLCIILCELLLLLVPAAILGAAVGAAAIRAALKLFVFSGSAVQVKTAIPWGNVLRMALLWAGAALFSRLLVFTAAVRMPLTGRLRLNSGGSMWAKRFRSGLVLVLGALSAFAVVYVAVYYPSAHIMIDSYSSYPPYSIEINSKDVGVISGQDCELLASVPGVASLDGYNLMPAGLTLPGEAETDVELFAIDETAWTDAFQFSDDAEEAAFHRGEFVLLITPKDIEEAPETCVISAHRGNRGGGELLLSAQIPVKAVHGPAGTSNRTLPFDPYDVVCSHSFLENMLASMEPGEMWGELRAGDVYGYRAVFLMADRNAKDLSTDISLEHICQSNGAKGWSLKNDRASYQGIVQSYQKSLLLVIAVGSCTVLVSVMILWSVLTLEAEQERRRFGLLRALGMSMRQVRQGLVKGASVRSLISVASGCFIRFVWEIYNELASPAMPGKADMTVFQRLISIILLDFSGSYRNYYISAILVCLIFLFTLAIVSKRKIMKGGAGDVCDIISAGAV